MLFGAILGDIIGAPHEFDRGDKTKDFPLFGKWSDFTDDTVMTVAVADAILSAGTDADDETLRKAMVVSMRWMGKVYPGRGYGARFVHWLEQSEPKPYGSFGNGAPMRVSPVAWAWDDLDSVLHAAEISAAVSHDHPEGIKGAQAVAGAIFLARTGHSKQEIKDFVTGRFGYDLSRSCDEIRPKYRHVESCQESVPEAITAFLEGESFEDVIRTTISLGGDCDTLTAIAGSIAEAFYGVPDELKVKAEKILDEELMDIVCEFEKKFRKA